MVNRSARTLYTPFAPAEGEAMSRDLALRSAADAAADPWDGRPPREGHFIALLRDRLPRFRLADLRWRNGASNYLDVLDAQRALFQSQQLEVIAQASLVQNQVNLYKALGGGWRGPLD